MSSLNMSAPLLKNEVIEKAKQLNTTTIADALNHNAVMDYTIKSVTRNSKLIGTAYTVSLRSGDNLQLHEAIYDSGQGYVLVVDGGGHLENAYLGELMAFAAEKMNVEGIIIDGLVRDKSILETLEIPIFAKGFIPSGPLKNGPGETNKLVSCGGVAVEPGDLVVGDDDGVVIVPKKDIPEVLMKAEKKLNDELDRLQHIESYKEGDDPNKSIKPKWLVEQSK